jgi:hypothetical protein
MIKRLTGVAGFLAVAVAMVAMAPSAKAQVTSTLPTTWKVNVVADAASKAQGRNDFVEYIYIETTSFSGDQICKLGFVVTSQTVTGTSTAGLYNVSATMTSNSQGTVTFTGTLSNTTMAGTLSWITGGKTYTYTYNGVPFTPDPNAES